MRSSSAFRNVLSSPELNASMYAFTCVDVGNVER
jgi:hypothetical protein